MTQSIDQGCILWFTGLSGSGKSTIAGIVVDDLRRRGHGVELLDGDEVREHLSKGLGYSKADRDTNIRRIGFVASLLARNGVVAVTAAISPYREVRDEVRGRIDHFVEIHIATSLEDCEARDVKGLYARARAGDGSCSDCCMSLGLLRYSRGRDRDIVLTRSTIRPGLKPVNNFGRQATCHPVGGALPP